MSAMLHHMLFGLGVEKSGHELSSLAFLMQGRNLHVCLVLAPTNRSDRVPEVSVENKMSKVISQAYHSLAPLAVVSDRRTCLHKSRVVEDRVLLVALK